MRQKLFTNGIKSISFIEGMIHLEFFNYIPGSQEDSDGHPESEVCQEMIMNPQGFIRTFDAIQRLANQLEESGIIQKGDEEEDDDFSGDAEKIISSPNWTN